MRDAPQIAGAKERQMIRTKICGRKRAIGFARKNRT
jgi:hypothetical protein